MPALAVDSDPAELGFSAERLGRIERFFQAYVDDGRLPGFLVAVTRRGRVVHVARSGARDMEAGRPVETDTLWRIYSMTKPITSVAAMMLYEQGALELTDRVARYIPAFADTRVFDGGSALKPLTVPQLHPMTVRHLLMHTSGLTYGFHHAHPVDAIYRRAGLEWTLPEGLDLQACCEAWARLPLLFQPGAEWNYSVSTDVLGRVVEVVSGQSLDAFFHEHILGPLDMVDTGFAVADGEGERLAALYTPDPGTGKAKREKQLGERVLSPPQALMGGSGLVSTAHDYHRFTQMLLNEGELDGVRLLGSRTLRYMTRNQLPGGADLAVFGRPLFAETPFDGVGFGLGFGVVTDPVALGLPRTAGEYTWGGAASTSFWVDPAEGITVLFFTQLLPSSTWPIRSQLAQLVMQALVD